MPYQPKVLVVDDDENILSAFRDFLKKERCDMIASSSADEAMEQLGRHHINLLIADVRLKGTSGVTFLIHVRRLYPKLPTVVITGYPDVISENDARAFGADYFFLKPLDLDKLRDAVKNCLRVNGFAHHKHMRIRTREP